MNIKIWGLLLTPWLLFLWAGGAYPQGPTAGDKEKTAAYKVMKRQKQNRLVAERKAELQMLKDWGVTPEQLEKWQRLQDKRFLREMKNISPER
jgi:hypothetical protein